MSFLAHAQAHGLRLDSVIADSRWHRCPTENHPRKKNGAYIFDGVSGAVRDFATMIDFATFREGSGTLVSVQEWRAIRRKSREDERARHQRARVQALALMAEASFGPHTYLKRKGFPETVGLVHSSGDLLIPMREFGDYSKVNSLQRINETGEKKFLPGGRAKNSVFILGSSSRETWLVEGYATGLTVDAALRDLRRTGRVVVCFSAGNLVHVAAHCPNAFVFADNDTSGAGQEAARLSRLPWVMSPVVGQDANDLMAASGLRAVVRVMQEVSHG